MTSPLELEVVTKDLLAVHGEFVSGKALRLLLGFRSDRTYLKAIQEKKVPVLLIRLEGRKGHFARVRDVARWICSFNPNA